MRDFFKALRGGFGFLTTIPVGITMEGIESLMKHIYLFPVIGAVIGLLLAGVGYLSLTLFPTMLTSIVIIISIYYLTGFNHIDGLADFGDGLAAHGTREKKIAAMRDTAVGTGGIVFCMLMLLGVFSSLNTIQDNIVKSLPFVLIISETCGKQSMVTVAALGRRLHEGFGAMTIENTKITDFITGFVISAAVCSFLLGIFGLEALLFSQLSALFVLHTANRHFGGVSGDIIGASNEIGRLSAFIFIGGFSWML